MNRSLLRTALRQFCQQHNCSDLVKLYTGPNCCQDPSLNTTFFEYEPQSACTKNLVQFSQMIRNGNITMFDYTDKDENKKKYGQSFPPPYEMSRIPNNLPLFLSHGGADALSVVEDVKLLLKDLQGHDPDKLVVNFVDEYAHMDFVFGVNAKQLVYDPLIAFIQRY
ncbi:hypothetical protein K1719_028800 [Acacia pycnantha]|nr:hypothetical protein K1719_028800 [Acacia pycnantha]